MVDRFDHFTDDERWRIMANAERVRQVVPAPERAEQTIAVYDTAIFMLGVPLRRDGIAVAFAAMAWARENT